MKMCAFSGQPDRRSWSRTSMNAMLATTLRFQFERQPSLSNVDSKVLAFTGFGYPLTRSFHFNEIDYWGLEPVHEAQTACLRFDNHSSRET